MQPPLRRETGIIQLVSTTEQAVGAVDDAIAAGKRIVVRSGGHCFEDFTSSPDVNVVLDLSPMSDVYFEEQRGAFAIEGGAALGHVYRMLFKGWGITIPAGTCFEVGVGGHIAGGGYGHPSRRDGLVIDHLYAVEVLVVDDTGRARAVGATREPDDPNHGLWWASTGGGGGNFGVVTRFWRRTPAVDSADLAELLPKAPANVLRVDVMWPWESMTEEAFVRLVRNYCEWFDNNSGPDSPYVNLGTDFIITHRFSGMFGLTAVMGAATRMRSGWWPPNSMPSTPVSGGTHGGRAGSRSVAEQVDVVLQLPERPRRPLQEQGCLSPKAAARPTDQDGLQISVRRGVRLRQHVGLLGAHRGRWKDQRGHTGGNRHPTARLDPEGFLRQRRVVAGGRGRPKRSAPSA